MSKYQVPSDLTRFSQLNQYWVQNTVISGSEAIKLEMEGLGDGEIKADAVYVIQDTGWVKKYDVEEVSVLWGWALRVSIEVASGSVDANVDVSGFVAENHTKANAGRMSVHLLGFNNPEVQALIPDSLSVNVNGYAEVIGAAKTIETLANDNVEGTTFEPVIINVTRPPIPVEQYTRSAYELWALSALCGHRGSGSGEHVPMSIKEAQDYISGSKAPLRNKQLFMDTIVAVYKGFGISNLESKPSKSQADHAFEIADGFFTRRGTP